MSIYCSKFLPEWFQINNFKEHPPPARYSESEDCVEYPKP